MKKHSTILRCLALCLVALLLLPLSANAAENKSSDLINILLVGRDADADAPARSDAIILCSVRPETKAVTAISFLRDLYLPIPGHQDNRLNAAYALGGAELLQQTLQENFGISIDGWVEADFSTFPQIIDLLGGVELELRQDEADAICRKVPGTLTQGTQVLNGQQALAYSRLRKLDQDGDISRSSRQRKLIASLLERYRSASLLTLLAAVVDILPMLSTDLSKREVLSLSGKLFPLMEGSTFSSQRIPADGTYHSQIIRGMDVLEADLNENKEILINLLS